MPPTAHTSSRSRELLHLIAATVLLPISILLFGLWEGSRGIDDWRAFVAEQQRLNQVVVAFEGRAPQTGRTDFTMQFRHGGQNYAGPLALQKARDARDEVATLATIMDWRRVLPTVAVIGGGLAAALSLFLLVAGALLGRLGRLSRNALVVGFSLVRRLLPAALAVQILAATAGFVAVVVFEAAILIQGGFSGDTLKLAGIAIVAVGAVVLAAGGTLLALYRARGAFEPDPLTILGRRVSRAEAPGLWRLIEGLGRRLGALEPDAVVVGLTQGFFVTAGPVVLQPSGAQLTGRTLYLPLPHLALLRGDETAAIIGHELAHYAGGDTDYSQRFLPIYAGVERSLDAVAARHAGGLGLLGPSLRLGIFVMERFHLAVRHWSRVREFAADAVGADVTSAQASARALLRSGAIEPRIAEILDAAAMAPASAAPNLVAAVLDNAVARGLEDPQAHGEARQPHPTDTHPPTSERVTALGLAIDTDLLAAAGLTPPPHAIDQLAGYFADPNALCRAATDDFVGAVRAHEAAIRAHLEATVAEVGTQERILRANYRARGTVLAVGAGLFALLALASLPFGIPGISPHEARVVLGTLLILTAFMGAPAAFMLLRQEPVVLILSPAGLKAPGLDRTVPWADITDVDMTTTYGGMIIRLLLSSDGAWPVLMKRKRGAALDAAGRIVTLTVLVPRGLKPQSFADLIGSYRTASQARQALLETQIDRSFQPLVGPAEPARTSPADTPLPRLAEPLHLPQPKQHWLASFWILFGVVTLGAMLAACVVYTAPVVVSDWQIRDTAQPTAAARMTDGECSTKIVIHICDVTLTLRTSQGTVTRRVNYVFSGLYVGDYSAGVMADPARLDLITTDLGLDRLWNRTITLLVIAGALAASIIGALMSVVRSHRASASTR